ncbi:hypothetical protein [Trinickia acidisoli]|uniref:hypothetical protein n=1 Tax=Trinickia acidisoli TaxID=2767482 RepID=UPI001A8C6CE7|nr:hypothetical protein [Trinickia acidisoli]
MHKRLASRVSRHTQQRLTLSPARLVRRASARALRHHVARTRVLPRRDAAPLATARAGGLLRAWLRAVISALRTGTRGRRLLLRRLLRRTTIRRSSIAGTQHAASIGSRRPRRLSASAGWFAFAAR